MKTVEAEKDGNDLKWIIHFKLWTVILVILKCNVKKTLNITEE